MTENIIETTTPLRPEYHPDQIVNRTEEHAKLQSAFAADTGLSQNLLIRGARGTGKTTLVRDTIADTPDSTLTSYISCRTHDTQYKVLQQLCRVLTSEEVSDGLHTSDLQRVFAKGTDAVPILLVLDDIEFLLLNDGSDLLYFLSRLAQSEPTRLVLLSAENESAFIGRLDERVYSSLAPETVGLDAYTADAICQILRERAEKAFTEHSLHRDALAYIGASTQNAAFAIHWLRVAADHTTDVITETIAEATYEDAYEEYVGTLLDDFSVHHQYLYQGVKRVATTTQAARSGQVYEAYQEVCASINKKPLSKRTISDYLKQLESLDLIDATYYYGGNEGKTREITLRRAV